MAAILLIPAKRHSKLACKGATAICGITEEILNWGLRRAGRAGTQWDRWFAFGYQTTMPDTESLEEAERYWDELAVRANSSFRVCFIGSMGRTYDLDQVMDAASRLAGETEVSFVLCGVGERLPLYRQMAKSLNNVLLPGRINAAQIKVLMQRCSVGLDPMPERFDFLATINNKAIEYMSEGLPVISCPGRGVLNEMLSAEGCGTSWKAGDGADLARVLTDLSRAPTTIKRMSTQSKKAFEKRFRADVVYAEMASYLEQLAQHNFS
jgi:glycosyltransferase involved in cell wall biosynthesis